MAAWELHWEHLLIHVVPMEIAACSQGITPLCEASAICVLNQTWPYFIRLDSDVNRKCEITRRGRECWSVGLFIFLSLCYQRSVLAVVEKEADRGKALLTCLLRQIKSSICISCAPMEKDLSSAQWEREREWKKEEVGEGDKMRSQKKRKGEICLCVLPSFLPSLCPLLSRQWNGIREQL